MLKKQLRTLKLACLFSLLFGTSAAFSLDDSALIKIENHIYFESEVIRYLKAIEGVECEVPSSLVKRLFDKTTFVPKQKINNDLVIFLKLILFFDKTVVTKLDLNLKQNCNHAKDIQKYVIKLINLDKFLTTRFIDQSNSSKNIDQNIRTSIGNFLISLDNELPHQIF